jgi:hypothetical protein
LGTFSLELNLGQVISMQMSYWLPLVPFLLALSALAQAPRRIYDDEDKRQVELLRRLEERSIDYQDFLAQAFQTRIDFYGQVVDQDGIAIEGARVVYSPDGDLRALGGNSPRFEMMTVKGGLFAIHTKGSGLYISVRKEGYRDVRIKAPGSIKPGDRVGSGQRIQYFAMETGPEFNHRPVVDRPVQFTLRKVGKIYNLLATDKRLDPKSNGEPLRVSLNGNEGSGHEIQIICKSDFGRTPVQVGVPHKYAWSFEIVVENGGIQEMKDEEGFEAPESGYVPKLTMASMDISAANWLNDFWQKNYYVRFDDGVCARFECQGGTEHGNGKDKPFVYLDGLLNPDSKSRSLETAPIR